MLFPGQGSQHATMFERLRGEPEAEETFAEVRERLGYDVRERGLRQHASTLDAQVGLLVCGVASVRVLRGNAIPIHAVAGHSVGAFAAAVAADSLAFEDALVLVRERAIAMASLFADGFGMVAIMGLGESTIRSLIAAHVRSGERLFVANINAPLQVVLAGENGALAKAIVEAKAAGARRAERIDVAVPSHCALLQPVQERLERRLNDIEVRTPQIDYVGSLGARILRDAQSVRADLAAGVAHEVRWFDAVTTLVETGTTFCIEAVPGRVLTDLAEAAFPSVRSVAMEEHTTRSIAALARANVP